MHEPMTILMKCFSVTMDQKTLNKLDKFTGDRSLNRSSGIRLIINEYLIREGRQ